MDIRERNREQQILEHPGRTAIVGLGFVLVFVLVGN